VGLVGLILKQTFAENEAEVEPLIVSKAYRRKGIGKRLVETAIIEAHKMGVRALSVSPVARNMETIRFLNKQGFTNIGFIELFIDFSSRTWKSGLQIFGCDFNI
jgi:GNAT superfamily N-acetyltransferase